MGQGPAVVGASGPPFDKLRDRHKLRDRCRLPETLTDLVSVLASRVVIDTNNSYPERDGHIAELDEATTTTAEMLQAHLPEQESVADDGKVFVGSP